jgi:hypothetical protein
MSQTKEEFALSLIERVKLLELDLDETKKELEAAERRFDELMDAKRKPPIRSTEAEWSERQATLSPDKRQGSSSSWDNYGTLTAINHNKNQLSLTP